MCGCWSRLRNCVVVVAGVVDVAVGGYREVWIGYMWEWVIPRSLMGGFCGDLYPGGCCGNIRILYSSPGGSRHTGHIF